MSKSIIIINTPKTCIKCPCFNCNEYDTYCGITDKFVEYVVNAGYVKPDWCPLSPLPEPKDLTQYTTGSTNLDKIIQYAHDQGYNDCLYQLNGGNL